MQHSNLYALDGLLILGVALVCVTILSGLRGLYCRTAAAVTEVDESSEAKPNPPSRHTPAGSPTGRRAA